MIDPATLASLGRRKDEILSRIRSLEQRIITKYPSVAQSVCSPRLKQFSIQKSVLSMSISSSNHIPTLQEEIGPDSPKQNTAYFEVPVKSMQEVKRSWNGPINEECSRISGEDVRPARYFGASFDLNVMNSDLSPKRYSIKDSERKSPIKDSQLRMVDSDIQDNVKVDKESKVEEPVELSQLQQSSFCKAEASEQIIPAHRYNQLIESDKKQKSGWKSNRSKGLSSCRKEDHSVSHFKSSSKKVELEMTSPRGYMERYLRSLKCQARPIVQEFTAIQIGQQARNKVVDSTQIFNQGIEQRMMITLTNPQTSNKKPQKDSVNSFDLQNKMRDALIKKVFEMQDVKKYK